MKSTVIWVVVGAVAVFGGYANAWGGLFNRFSPEILANMGYGSHGGGLRPQYYQVSFMIIITTVFIPHISRQTNFLIR